MNKVKKLSLRGLRPNNYVVWILIAGTAVTAVLFMAFAAYQHRFTLNPDGIAYISIAEHYLAGDFAAAVNGYWSPMLSWLMVPFLALGFAGETAFAIVNLVVCVFILLFGSFLVYRLTNHKLLAFFYGISVLPFLLSVLVGPITPDSLVAAWVMIFMWVLLVAGRRLDVGAQIKTYVIWAVILGTVGALGYVTKLFLQPVFVVSLIGFVAMQYMTRRDDNSTAYVKKLSVFAVVTLAVYSAVSLLWVIPISMKYGRIMIGSSYEFNLGPRNIPASRMLLPLPHDSSLTAWEDPTYITKYKSINPPPVEEEDKASRISRFYSDFPDYLQSVAKLWILIYSIALFALAAVILRLKSLDYFVEKAQYPLLVFAVYFAGYAAVGGDTLGRYIWPLLILGLILAMVTARWYLGLINGTKQSRYYTLRKISAYLLVFAVPLTMFLEYSPYPGDYISRSNQSRLHKTTEDLRDRGVIPEGSKIAGNNFRAVTYVGYYLKSPSLGTIPPGSSLLDADVRTSLLKHEVKYFVSFTDRYNIPVAPEDKLLYSAGTSPRWCSGLSGSKCMISVIKLGSR